MIHTVKRGETLSSIAGDYRISLAALIASNPGITPNLIYVGQRITIPGFPSPASLPFSIVVSLSDRTLTLFYRGQVRKVYPVGVGRMLHETPVGDFIIINKAPNPGGPY